MAGFHSVTDEFVIVEGYFEIPITAGKVGIQDVGHYVQLATNTSE